VYEPDQVLEHLLAAGAAGALLVGDNVAPAEGGWVNGQPQSGLFRPYSVLMLGQSSAESGLREKVDWTTQFSVRHFGGSRPQASKQSNRMRVALQVPWVQGPWRSMRLHWAVLGSMQRVDSVDPPYWQIYDALEVRVGKAC
jgi:allophanate hydrolase subunit 2